jgi:hypothetical protein
VGDSNFNDDIVHDRVLAENYFGRLKSKFLPLHDKYRGNLSNLPIWFKLAVVAVTFDIEEHPLRRGDGEGNVAP